MSQNLEEAGFAVIAFGQGFKDMNPPSKELMRRQPRPRRPPRTGMDGRRIHVRTDPAGNINPTSKSPPRRLAESSPPSWPSTEPSETAARQARAESTTNEGCWCSSELPIYLSSMHSFVEEILCAP